MRIWRTVAAGVLLLLSLNQVNAQSTNNADINDINPIIDVNNLTNNNQTSNNTANNNITSFSQLVQAVESGNDVRAIIHFEKCEVTQVGGPSQTIPNLEGATTRFNFTHYFHSLETINNALIDTVATSMEIFIQSASGEFLTLSGRLNVFEDNSATLHVDFINPILHHQRFGVDWQCTISNGDDNNGLVLFNFS